jgi:hypothetical protein
VSCRGATSRVLSFEICIWQSNWIRFFDFDWNKKERVWQFFAYSRSKVEARKQTRIRERYVTPEPKISLFIFDRLANPNEDLVIF